MKAAQGRKQAIEGLKQLQKSRKTGRIAARKGQNSLIIQHNITIQK